MSAKPVPGTSGEEPRTTSASKRGATSAEPVLEVEGLSKSYRSAGFGGLGSQIVPVLNNISLNLYKGETLVLLGKSGSGKTTLARCIMRLEDTQAGTIRSERGLIVGTNRKTLLSRHDLYRFIQLVPQATGNYLNPFQTVEHIITTILQTVARGQGSMANINKLKEILDLSGLDSSLLKRRPIELSGGQRQRLLLARALAMDPAIIIFDEPVSSLDLSIQARILNTLIRLKQQRGLSYIFITHDHDIADYVQDRTIIIENASLVPMPR